MYQAGAIPWRRQPDGSVEVLLITSSSGGWSFPKGHVDPGSTEEDTARIEAWEEAGVEGYVDGDILDTFDYEKYERVHEVAVFPLSVYQECSNWPEDEDRERRWVLLSEIESELDRTDFLPAAKELAIRLDVDIR